MQSVLNTLNIIPLFVILSLTQLYRYTREIFLFSTATFKYKYRAPLRRIGQEYSAKVAFYIFQSLKRIQPFPVYAGFFICIRNSLDRPCVTMPSWSSPLPYFKVNICPLPLPHFASIFFASLWSFRWPNYIVTLPRYFSFRLPHLNISTLRQIGQE